MQNPFLLSLETSEMMHFIDPHLFGVPFKESNCHHKHPVPIHAFHIAGLALL